MSELKRFPERAPGTGALVATGCGTAIASVCIAGLFQIERLVGGVWSAAAILTAGVCCIALARAFARMNDVVPSGAGLLAYLSRGLGRSWGIGLAAPYVLLTLFLAGAEATIVGLLVSRLFLVPPAAGALGFLIGTWWLCRSGIRIGYGTQAAATWLLVGGLAVLSVAAVFGAVMRGELHARLLPAAPSLARFVAAAGEAFFLFMGFEFIVSHAEIARDSRAIRKALSRSVWILAAFYGLVSLGFSCLSASADASNLRTLPQLAIASQEGGPWAVIAAAVLSLLASFTSLNGALLTLSRFVQALASQRVLPHGLSRIDARTLVPRRALDILLVLAIVSTGVITWGNVFDASILAGAFSVCVVYAASMWARGRAPFREPGRHAAWQAAGVLLSLMLAGLGGAAVLVSGGKAAPAALVLCGFAYAAAAWFAFRKFSLSHHARRAPAGQEVAHAD